MASSLPVRIGPWTDYNIRPQAGGLANVITVTETWGTILKIFVGVVFGLSWPCAALILVRSWSWGRYLLHKRRSGEISTSASTIEQQPLLPSNESSSATAELPGDLGEVDITQAGVNNLHLSTMRSHSAYQLLDSDGRVSESVESNIAIKPSYWWPNLFLAAFLAAAAILFAAAGGAAGEIPTSTSALSDAQTCGFWDLKSNADQRIRDNDDLFQAQKEARAAQYGRDCYGDRSVGNPEQCEFLETKKIEYTVEKIDCPFRCPDPDHCICANGIYGSAIRLETGVFGADMLGLNGDRLPQIKRTSTFVPLDIDYGFVIDKSGVEFEFEYHLGSVNASGEFRNHTFTMFGTPFDWDIPAYSVSAYESTPSGKEYDAWQPISELARPSNSFMTAIFISPCRIIYSGRCEDYIFKATEELTGEGWPKHRFYNQDPRARVLIAIDQMEVCMPDSGHCFHPNEEHPENGIEYEIVRNALRRSSSFRSIRFRLGSALIATESISDFESRQLDKEQWIIESKALFNTSLSRLQFNALDIATGDRPIGDAAAGFEDAYDDTTPSWAKGRMCGRYKFHLPRGYTNINIAESIGILAVPFLIWFFSLETSWPLEPTREPWLHGNWMYFDTCIWAVVYTVKWGIKKLRKE